MVATRIRAGRATRSLCAIQSAKGTPVRDFTASGTTVESLWGEKIDIDAGKLYNDPGPWMTGFDAEAASGRYEIPKAAEGNLVMPATAAALEILLQSNWGTRSGGGVFTLTSQVNKWLTLGWVEDNALGSGAPQNFVTLSDAFIHRLGLAINSLGKVIVTAGYAAEAESEVRALDELGDPPAITLPSTPMDPGDKYIAAGRSATLRRDPSGANQLIPFDTVDLLLDQALASTDYDMMRQVRPVFKNGLTAVDLSIEAMVGYETWIILANAISGSLQDYRLTIPFPAGAGSSLIVHMRQVLFNVSPLGRTPNQQYVKFSARGRALCDTSGDFVDITLS